MKHLDLRRLGQQFGWGWRKRTRGGRQSLWAVASLGKEKRCISRLEAIATSCKKLVGWRLSPMLTFVAAVAVNSLAIGDPSGSMLESLLFGCCARWNCCEL